MSTLKGEGGKGWRMAHNSHILGILLNPKSTTEITQSCKADYKATIE